MAHLVLPHTQADPSQNQKSHFLPALLHGESGREGVEPRPDLGRRIEFLPRVLRAFANPPGQFHRGRQLGGLGGAEPVDAAEVMRIPGRERGQGAGLGEQGRRDDRRRRALGPRADQQLKEFGVEQGARPEADEAFARTVFRRLHPPMTVSSARGLNAGYASAKPTSRSSGCRAGLLVEERDLAGLDVVHRAEDGDLARRLQLARSGPGEGRTARIHRGEEGNLAIGIIQRFSPPASCVWAQLLHRAGPDGKALVIVSTALQAVPNAFNFNTRGRVLSPS